MTFKLNTTGRVKVEIVNFDQSKRVDIRYQIAELNIYEDITKKAILGDALLYDALDIIQEFPIIGEEEINITFSYAGADDHVNLSMRLYSIEDIVRDGNDAAQTFKITFASKEVFNNLQSSVENGFSGTKISDIVKKICLDHLKTTEKLDITTTSNAYNFAFTDDKAYDAIDLVKEYAWTSDRYSTFFFWQDISGIHFKPIESLLTQESKQTYNYRMQNIKSLEEDNAFSISNFSVVQNSNFIKHLNDGMLSNTLLEVDILGKSYKKTTYEYQANFDDLPHLNSKKLTTQSYQTGITDMLPTNDISGIDNQKNYAFYRKHRKSLIAQLNTNVIEIAISGDHTIRPGNIVTLDIPTASSVESLPPNHRYLSGRYLVSRVRNKINGDIYQTYLQLVKESSKNKIKSLT